MENILKELEERGLIKDFSNREAVYNLLYGEEKAALLLSGKTLTTKYEGEDVVTSYVTVDNENMTFVGSFLI